MGLDIHIVADNYHELYDDKDDCFDKHSLSRTFCNFMCRKDVIDGEPELNQIGRITGVDISPLYDMEGYPEEEGLEFFLSTADNEKEKQNIIAQAEASKERVLGNIDKVLHTISILIDKLEQVDNLPDLLAPTDFDSLGNEEYFSDFKSDKGEGYIGNSLGQDLRNFKRFLEFAKSKGASTVWFNYS